MKEEWLLRGAAVPVDVETTAALVAEIHRLIGVVGGMALAQPDNASDYGALREDIAAWNQRQPEERNFCPRCGKRTADQTTIHTCTPPQTIEDEHIAKVTSDINSAVYKALAQPPLPVQPEQERYFCQRCLRQT